MADDVVANGGFDYQYGEESATKIAVLQRERDELASENAARQEEIEKLTAELDGWRSDGAEMSEKIKEMQEEVERSRDAAKAAQVIAARAADLETEVARMQFDMVSESCVAEEARAGAAEFRKLLEEKEARIESLEKELAGLKRVKAESDVRVKDWERKIGVLETKEIEERNKRIRFEEEMRDKIEEKEREIKGFRQRVEELDKVAAEKKSELGELVRQKLRLEEALKESEQKVTGLESSILQLQGEAKEAERVIISLNEKAVETVETMDRGINGIHSEGKELKFQWPVVAAGSTGAVIAAAAVIYVCYGKRR